MKRFSGIGVNRPVLLYSGGLDSFALRKKLEKDGRDPILLHCITGTRDNALEVRRLRLDPAVRFLNLEFLAGFELDNKIVPFRNAFFVLAAAQFSTEVYLAATYGDSTKDKDLVFAHLLSAFLNYFGQDDHKVSVHGHFQVLIPFRNLTKREIIEMGIREGWFGKQEILRESRSCYSGDSLECGVCRSCLRKATALVAAGLISSQQELSLYFQENPFIRVPEKVMKKRGREYEDYKQARAVLKKG